MDSVPEPAALRAALAPLDDIDRKVLGGLVTLLIAAPARCRDREWQSQQFVQLAVVAHGWPADGAAGPADVERIHAYAQRRSRDLLGLALQLFVRTAADLQARGGPFAAADAQAIVRGYLGS